MPIALGPMSLGEILDRALRITLTRFGVFFAIACIFLAPGQVAGFGLNRFMFESQVALQRGDFSSLPILMGGVSAILVLQLVLRPMAMAGSLAVVAHEVLGRPFGLSGALGFAMRRFLPLLVASFLFNLIWPVGCLACCAPGVMLYAWFSVFAPVIVVEHAGPIESLQRSLALTEGYRWTAVAILAIELALYLALSMVVSVVMLFTGEISMTGTGQPPTILSAVLGFIVGVLVETYFGVVWSLYYFDLRIRKEGFDLTLLSQGQAG